MRILITVTLLILSFNTAGLNLVVKNELDIALNEAQLEHGIPALAVGVISSGELLYAAGFGYLDVSKTKSVSEQSLFRVASISKLFTAQAIMQLVEKQQLELDDTIGRHLPSFKTSKITIRQLLTHSSGLKDRIRPVPVESKRTHQEYLDSVSQSVEEHVTEAEFEYSDTGFNILGSIVSSVSGMKFEDYVKKNILTPTDMERSGYFNGKNGVSAEAEPTFKGNLIAIGEQRPYDATFHPSEGLVSNISDLSKWLSSTLTHNTSILTKETYKQMLTPQIKTSWGNIYMGLGWQVYETESTLVARHPGSIRGYKSLILSFPDDKKAIILLTNSSDAPRWEIANLITKKLKQLKLWK